MLKSPSPSLLVVIVNYRTPQLTIDCLQSLQTEVKHHANTRVVVADNQSGDGSVAVLRDAIASYHWQDWVTLQSLDRNGGFAAGNNAVVGPALESTHPPDYIWLLNPDTVVHPGALKTLLTFLEQHPDVGIAGSRLENLDGTPQYSAFRFHTIWSELDQGLRLGLVSKILSQWILAPSIADQAIATDWLAGASMMIRRQVFEQIGLLDDNFFMYYEEVDFCLRARQANWTCWYVPTSRVVHLMGQSSGVTGAQACQQRRPQYWFDSRHRYFHKHHSHLYAVLTDLAWLGGYSLWQLRQLVQHKPQVDPPHLLQDFFCNSAFVKGGQCRSEI